MGRVGVVVVAVVLALLAATPAGAATGCVLDTQTCTVEAGAAQATCYAQPNSGATQDEYRGCVAASSDGATSAGCTDYDTQWGGSTATETGCTASVAGASASCTRSTQHLSITGSGESRSCGTAAGAVAAGCGDADWQDPGFQAGEQYTATCQAGAAASCTSGGSTNFDTDGSARETACATPAGTCTVSESPDPLTQQEDPFAPAVPPGITNPPAVTGCP